MRLSQGLRTVATLEAVKGGRLRSEHGASVPGPEAVPKYERKLKRQTKLAQLSGIEFTADD